MILRQYLHTEPIVAASYLFGCGIEAVGAVVDLMEDIDIYLRESEALSLPIRYVVDTHVHADHVSGGRRLTEAAGADYVLFAGAGARLSFRGRGLSGKVSSTIGFERRFNRAFGLTDEYPFVRRMLEDVPPRPPRAVETRQQNLGLAAVVAG